MPNSVLEDIIGLDPAALGTLLRNDFHCARDVLFCSPTDLMELLDISLTQAEQLMQAISAHACPAYSTVRLTPKSGDDVLFPFGMMVVAHAYQVPTQALELHQALQEAPVLRTGLPVRHAHVVMPAWGPDRSS